MDAAAEIAAIEEHSGRAAGTDAERRAANHLRARLEDAGREAEVQPIEVRPRFGLAHALHALAAIAGGVLATSEPELGAALVLAALVSAALDVSGAAHLARRLTGRRASQNVEAREERGLPGVVILAAGYDSPRAAPRALRRDPWTVLLAAMLAVLGCALARVAGAEGTLLSAVQLVPTVVLILLPAPLIEVELSRAAHDPPGAAGAAVVLQLAEELGGRLGQFELWLLFTGASRPFGLGMARWLRRRRAGLAGRRAVVLAVGPIGDGELRYATRQGPVLPRRSDRELLRLCSEIAEDDADGAYGAAPAVLRGPGDGFSAIARGVPALTVWSEGERAGDVGRAAGFCRELVERLDSAAALRRG